MLTNKSLNAYKNTELILFIYSKAVEKFAEMLVEYKLIFNWQMSKHRCLDFMIYKLILDGYGSTDKSKNYLQDIITRLAQLDLKREVIAKIDYKDIYCDKYDVKFSDFGNLPSIQQKKPFFDSRKATDYDPYFWYMKHYIEYLIKLRVAHPLSYQNLMLDEALKRFPSKDFSTLKAKAKSIFAWYERRNFECYETYTRKFTDEELTMTRSENMKRVKTNQKSDTRNKIKGVLDDDVLFNEYRHTEGRWAGRVNVEKLAKRLNMRNETIRSHLKEMGIR